MKFNIVEKFNQLPPDRKEKAIDFIDPLLIQKEFRRQKKPKLDWAGGLEELRNEYTAVELQEKVSDWIVESALSKPTQKRKEPAEVLK